MIPYQTDPESIEKAKKRILSILDKYSASRKASANKRKKKTKIKSKNKDSVIVCPIQKSVQPKIVKENNPEMILSARRIKIDNNNIHQSNPPKNTNLYMLTQQEVTNASNLPRKIEFYEADNQMSQTQPTKSKRFKPKSPKEKQSEAIRAPRNMNQKGSDQNDPTNKNDTPKSKEQNAKKVRKCRKSNKKSKRNENNLSNPPQIEQKQEIQNSTKNEQKGQIIFNPIALPDFGDDDNNDLNEKNLPIISDLPVEKPFVVHSYFDFTKPASGKNLIIDLNHPIYSTSSCSVFISKDNSNPPVYYAVKSSSFISRIEREFSTYKLINHHPSIISCYDMWNDEGTAFLQLELSQKGSIRGNLFSFNNTQIWQIFSHIIFALQKLHSIGYIHLDISPSNILQCRSFDDSFDVYKLSDFGISLPIGSFEEDCDGAGPYLSPEALLFPDTEFEVGPKADIFSFGVVMMEIVTKKLAPRNCDNYKALRNGNFDFSVLCLPDEFSFIKNMLDPNPTKRPSAEQLSLLKPVKKEIDKLVLSTNNIKKHIQFRVNQAQEKQTNLNLQKTPMKQNSLQSPIKQNLLQSSVKQNAQQSPQVQSSLQSPTWHSSLQSTLKQDDHQTQRKLNLDDSFDSSDNNSPIKNGSSAFTSLSSEQLESNQLIQKNSNSIKEQQLKIKTRQKQQVILTNPNLQQSPMKQFSLQSPMKQNQQQIRRKLGLNDTFNSSDDSSPNNNKKEINGLELSANIIKDQAIQQSPIQQKRLNFDDTFVSSDGSYPSSIKSDSNVGTVIKEIDNYEEQEASLIQKQINFDDTYDYSDEFLFIKESNDSILLKNQPAEKESDLSSSMENQSRYKINNIFDPFVPFGSSDSYNSSETYDNDCSFCNVAT